MKKKILILLIIIISLFSLNKSLYSNDEFIIFSSNKLPRSGLIGEWKCNEGTGQTLTDTSVSGVDMWLGSTSEADTNDPSWVTGGLSYDGVDNYCRQKYKAIQSGVIRLNLVNGSTYILDTTQNFSPYLGSAGNTPYYLVVKDISNNVAWGYLGEQSNILMPLQRGSVLTASDAAASDYFGRSVSLSSDGLILAVGAYSWEGANTDQGGVYIYDWSILTGKNAKIYSTKNGSTQNWKEINSSFDQYSALTYEIRKTDFQSLTSFSVCGWVNGVAQDSLYLFSKADVGNINRSIQVLSGTGANTAKLRVQLSQDGNTTNVKDYTSSLTLFDSTYNFWGVTWDGITLKLYIDGILDSNPTKTTDIAITGLFDSHSMLRFGAVGNNTAAASFLNGFESENRIWNRALSDSEMMKTFIISRNNLRARGLTIN